MTATQTAQASFSRTVMREFTNDLYATDEGKANAVYEAMNGYNTTTDTIRSTVNSIRSGLDQVMRYLDGGHNVYTAYETQRAAELDMAITKRSLYIQQLVALLGPDKVQELLAK